MNITQLVEMAERIHDAEHYDLGSGSSREYRNQFWARVVGCAYHGHPVYNPSPDRQWHIKKAGPSSPQSDDVCVSMPSREAWDCIPGSGANGYRFEADALGVLPAVQVVYAPPVPDGSGVPEPPEPPVPPTPQPPQYPPYPPNESDVDGAGAALFADFAQAGQSPNPQMFRFAFRVAYSWLTKEAPDLPASVAKHRREWRQLLGLPPL